jgi:hypothetical protein
VGSTEYGLGNPNVDGFYLDDHWTNGRPSEETWSCSKRGTGAGKCAGFSKADSDKMDSAWAVNMAAVQTAIVNQSGYDWQNFQTLRTPDKNSCSSFLRAECQSDSKAQTSAVQFGMSYKFKQDYSGGNLTNFEMDLGIFLTSRGPYSWLGYGW